MALCEEVKFKDGANTTFGWDDYPILGFDRVPNIEITILNRGNEYPLGCGEIAIGPTTAALLNAVSAETAFSNAAVVGPMAISPHPSGYSFPRLRIVISILGTRSKPKMG